MALIISHHNHMAIISANNISGYKHYDNNICHNQHKRVGLPGINNKIDKKISNIWQNVSKTNIVNDNSPHTPSKVGVLESITFSHTPEEAMSVGLAKACVFFEKIYSVLEKLSSLKKY